MLPNYNIYIQNETVCCCVSFHTQLMLTQGDWIVYRTVCNVR